MNAFRFVALIYLLLPAVVQAQFTYNTNNNAIAILGYDCSSKDVTFPSSINGLPVRAISYALQSCPSFITSATIPDSVTSINGTFQGCTSLTNVTIGNSVTNIYANTFNHCTSLTHITIPDSVNSIGQSAFSGCTNLTDITIPDGVTSLGQNAFYYCTGLTGVYFQGNAPSVGANTFYNDTNATVYYLPGATGFGTTYGGLPTALWTEPSLAIVSLAPNPTQGGTVDGGGAYMIGSTQQILANAMSGWAFIGWSDSNTQNPRSIIVPSSGAAYTANFTLAGAAPSGQFIYSFTNPPLWDISGTYTNDADPNDIVALDLEQHANGQITGFRSEIFNYGTFSGDSTGLVSGRIFSKPPVVGFRGKWTGNVSGVSGGVPFVGTAKGSGGTAVIVPSSLTLFSTGGSIRVCLVGAKCVTTHTGDFGIPLPGGMTGDWWLVLDTTAIGSKLTGTGTITLSSGRELNYQVTGDYNATAQTSKLRLVGTGDALGTSLSVTTQGAGMTLTQLKGKVLGQKLKLP